ncbi:hypothetical protein LRA02_08800 [Lentilactobacillus rapi]|uniref:Uncharacterized protein n=1 Tax=Lentilactobacillus rapi TaxID=481723 RepID=A0A512PLE6_9LACO|nr:hypothetical protein LRA02_08800 [Lentilactobacillus rapi]
MRLIIASIMISIDVAVILLQLVLAVRKECQLQPTLFLLVISLAGFSIGMAIYVLIN